jgi:hypothetical protein
MKMDVCRGVITRFRVESFVQEIFTNSWEFQLEVMKSPVVVGFTGLLFGCYGVVSIRLYDTSGLYDAIFRGRFPL